MPLPSSGPLSLNDIAGEFGGTQPHSLSEYYAGGGLVPAGTSGTNGAVPSSGTISIWNFYGTSNYVPIFGLGLISATLGNGDSRCIDTGSNNDFYMTGTLGADFFLSRYNSSGAIQWQRSLAISSNPGRGVAVDSSNNLYVCGSAGSSVWFVTKWDNSGSLLWQRTLTNPTSTGTLAGIVVDSSGNSYSTGFYFDSTNGNEMAVVKYNTSGTIQWQRLLSGTGSENSRAIAIDGSANVYLGGVSNTSGVNQICVAKYDTNGNLQWQRQIGGTGFTVVNGFGITASSGGNVYAVGFANTSTGSGSVIVKYDTNGNLQWQRRLSGMTNFFTGATIDASENVYIGTGSSEIIKYNSSGTLQWQRIFTTSAALNSFGKPISYANGFVNFLATLNSGSRPFFFARLRDDGSRTGTYSLGGFSIVYAATSYTADTPAMTSSTPTLTSSASSFTEAPGSYTVSTPTFTSTTVNI